jgi:RNA 2',3'-cyclic 3'-phosphodiesterase
MRLFVGVAIDPAVAAAAAALSDELRRRVERQAPRARLTWIPAERLHLTVRFIGSADVRLATAVTSAMAPPIAVAPFALSLGGVGAFPRTGKPRVLWADIVAGVDALHTVEREVTVRLDQVGIAPEPRPYNPHLTLARVRDPSGLKQQPLFAGLEGTALGTTHVRAITLYESRLSPTGPAYQPLQQTVLRQH